MSEAVKRATRATALATATGGGAPQWVHLLPAGRFDGAPVQGAGPWQNDRPAEVIRASMSAGQQLAIDYDHQSEFAPRPNVGGVAPAAGWIAELEAREDGIWGRVEWTDKGAAAVAGREYRFLSPVFTYDKAGRVLQVLRAALTNNPALNLTAISSKGEPPDMNEVLKALLAALGLQESATADQAKAAVAALKSSASTAAIARAAGLAETAAADDVAKAVATAVAKAAASPLPAIARAAGLAETATAEEVATAVARLKAAGAPDPAKFVPIDQHQALAAQVARLVGDKVAEAVDAAIADGKLIPVQRDWGLAYAGKDLAGFEAFIKAQPVLLAPGAMQKPAVAGADLTREEQAVASAMGVSAEAFKKTRDEHLKSKEGVR